MKWRYCVSLNLCLYLILVNDSLDRFHGLQVRPMVNVDSPCVPHRGVPVADHSDIEDRLPLGNRAVYGLLSVADQSFDLLAHLLRDEQVIVE